MLKIIANLFGSAPKEVQRSNDPSLSTMAKEDFLKDYVENLSFLEKFPDDIKPSIREKMESIKDNLNKTADPLFGDPIYHLFSGLQVLYMSLWLEEAGYGEKLALKLNQLTYIDDYGDHRFEDWNRELNKFVSDRIYKLDSYLRTQIPEKYQTYAKRLDLDSHLNVQLHDPDFPIREVVEDLSLIISLAIEPYADRLEASSECMLHKLDDPQEYERAVSNEFAKLGWQTRVTAGSGDQGADVIAEKLAFKLVIQCKLYTSPVGNKSVQEVAAAVKFFNGDIGAVITNNTFTKSARQLASSLGVFLVHHTQISALDRVIFEDDMDLEDPIDGQ